MMRFILLLAIFFGFLGFGQVRPLTPEDVPEDVKKVVDCSSLTFVVMKQPEFPGGMNEFRKKFSENFDLLFHFSAQPPIFVRISRLLWQETEAKI